MERKLASVQVIKEIIPIEGADVIELAVVNSWKVVVGKDVEHKVGDHVVYCEIDSFLPIREEFEFLRKSSYKKMGDDEGFRLRTIKLRGQISQGLILPISIFGDFSWTAYEGLDVTERLGIVKYEPPIPAELAGKVKGLFPSFLRKTDEERVQNLTKEYTEWSENELDFYVTEKLDGSSATFYYKDGEFGVCSRNLELLETEDNTFWKVARELKLEEKLAKLDRNLCIQGELIGEGIQGNPYKIKGQTVFFFNAFDIDNQYQYGVPMFLALMKIELKLETAPILTNLTMKLPKTVDEMLLYADGKSVLNPNFDREGVVVRSMDTTISFKAISNKFLLKEEKPSKGERLNWEKEN
jgi:RNA ligase (TIGR02306 family)